MKKNIILITVVVAILITIGTIFLVTREDNSNEIPSNYIAVFKGETRERVHTTYLYEVKKKHKKIKYKYINTISTLNGYDSVAWQEKVLKKGKLKKKTDIFKKAEKNYANSYVKYRKDDKVYTFEEFKNIWK